jgi:Domain of unknown function (DUF4258)
VPKAWEGEGHETEKWRLRAPFFVTITRMIRLTRHAEEAVEKRNIALDWIDRTVAMPDFNAIDPGDPTLTRPFKAIGEAGGRILRVVHRAEGNDIVIVTVHFDRDAKP